ncbi:MAG TPA: DUF3617 domain-containing protein [Pseudolabrys sp.]|nr:DUF3617 domain-containing protein [Pseudolabrys sp.]
MWPFYRYAVGILLAAWVALFAFDARAIDLQPGLWQDTETGEVNGKPMPPKVSTDCMTPEEAKDPVKQAQAALKDQQEQCSKADVRQNGNVITFEMKCGDPKQAQIDMTVAFTILTPQHTTSVAKSTMKFGGQTMTSNIATDSKWIGACKDKKK